MFESEKLRVEHVATNELQLNLADSLTKPQVKQKLKTFCENVGLLQQK